MMTNSSSNVAPVLEKVNGAILKSGVGKYLRVSADASDGATVAGSCLSMFDSGDDLRKEASWVFMQYLASAAVQADFAANTGYIPSNTAAMDEDIYKTVTAEYPQYLVAYDQLISTPADMRSVTVGPVQGFLLCDHAGRVRHARKRSDRRGNGRDHVRRDAESADRVRPEQRSRLIPIFPNF